MSGRLLRSPDGDHGDQNDSDQSDDKDDKSLINDQDNQNQDDQNKDDQNKDDQNADDKDKDQQDDDKSAVEPLKVEDIAVPEGFELQPELANKFLEILNGEMEPKDRANALIALHGETINAASEASSKAYEEMQTEWKGEVKADPDIGGAKLQPTLTNIGKLLSEFGTDELKDVFDLTGAGNNVHMIKFLNKIADKLTEGNFFTAGSPSNVSDPDASAKRMFPSMKG